MNVVANVLVGLVALIHVYILVLEMFLWNTPYGRRVFGSTPEFSRASTVLAANQGLYNGFLAAGLISDVTVSIIPILLGEGVRLFGRTGRDLPLELVARPHDVLVGGLGLGFTAHAVLGDDRVERLIVVEIDRT